MRLVPLPVDRRAERLARVVGGLVCFGIGLSFLVAADLGLPPWDVLHQGLERQFGLSIGLWINLVGVALVLVMLTLGEPLGIATVLNVIVIGQTLDLVLPLIDDQGSLLLRYGSLVIGVPLVAIGSGFYIGGGMGTGPRDGIMTALGRRGIMVWRARATIEATAFAVGVALGGTFGVGTIWFLVTIGPLVQWALRRMAMAPVVAPAADGALDPG